MRLKDSVVIEASPEIVWDYVSKPENMLEWNEKISYLEAISFGEPELGYRYEILYRLGSKENKFLAEISCFDAPELFEIRLVPKDTSKKPMRDDSYFIERYSLKAVVRGTKLTQEIKSYNFRLPFFVQILVSFISLFGSPVGVPYLKILKGKIEHGV